MAEKLKPCPFCGKQAKFYIRDFENKDTTQLHIIACEDRFNCGAEMNAFFSGWQPDYVEEVEKFKQRWNRRFDNAN